MTSPHDSIKLKEVWGYPECNYYSTTQESLHERAKRCPSRTLWATVFNINSIVSVNSDSILARLENLLEWQKRYDPQGSPATFEPGALSQKASEKSSELVTFSQM